MLVYICNLNNFRLHGQAHLSFREATSYLGDQPLSLDDASEICALSSWLLQSFPARLREQKSVNNKSQKGRDIYLTPSPADFYHFYLSKHVGAILISHDALLLLKFLFIVLLSRHRFTDTKLPCPHELIF